MTVGGIAEKLVSEAPERLLGASVESVQQRLQLPRRLQGRGGILASRCAGDSGKMPASGTHSVLGAGIVTVSHGSTATLSVTMEP